MIGGQRRGNERKNVEQISNSSPGQPGVPAQVTGIGVGDSGRKKSFGLGK